MYQRLYDSDAILRLEDGATVPADPANSDYRTYLAWCDEGNEALAADVPAPPPPAPIDTAPADMKPELVAFRAMSPEQLVGWIDANVVDFETLKAAFKNLSVGLLLVDRK